MAKLMRMAKTKVKEKGNGREMSTNFKKELRPLIESIIKEDKTKSAANLKTFGRSDSDLKNIKQLKKEYHNLGKEYSRFEQGEDFDDTESYATEIADEMQAIEDYLEAVGVKNIR
jgi:hypothetical protein